jgi:hypothetical protein
MREHEHSSSADHRGLENPVTERDNLRGSFERYVALIPPGIPEDHALRDLTLLYEARAAIAEQKVRARIEAQRTGIQENSERSKIARLTMEEKHLTVKRSFLNRRSQVRYNGVEYFFERRIVQPLLDSERAVYNQSLDSTEGGGNALDTEAYAFRAVAGWLGEVYTTFQQEREQLRKKYSGLLE